MRPPVTCRSIPQLSSHMQFFLSRGRPKHVIVYGKPGCHLCDDVILLLQKLGKRNHIELHEVDIRTDPDLFRRYDIIIPVVVIDGTVETHAPIDEQKLAEALRRRRHVRKRLLSRSPSK